MSQIKKSATEQKILKSAKAIFLKHGFTKASLRDIAKRANISLSNFYTYFPDKNALFVSVLQPVLDDLERLCEFGRTHRQEVNPFETLQEKKQYLRIALDYIDKHKLELNLLFNQSFGSSLENYSEHLAQEYENNWNLIFIDLKKKFPKHKFNKPSSFFLRNMAYFHIMTISKILVHDYSRAEMTNISDEIASFLWHGGMGLINKA
jgi:AcrR family transcriptional regulator